MYMISKECKQIVYEPTRNLKNHVNAMLFKTVR